MAKNYPPQCSQNYPNDLELSDRGVYTGTKTNPQENFTWWDVGTYEIRANNQVKIAIATDEIRVYRLCYAVEASEQEFSGLSDF